jgi:ribosomal protein L14E/L6E/L27E
MTTGIMPAGVMTPGMVGRIVISKAGHDKDCVYVVIKERDSFVTLVDGAKRTFYNPKKKNKLHIMNTNSFVDDIANCGDDEIRKVLLRFRKGEV